MLFYDVGVSQFCILNLSSQHVYVRYFVSSCIYQHYILQYTEVGFVFAISKIQLRPLSEQQNIQSILSILCIKKWSTGVLRMYRCAFVFIHLIRSQVLSRKDETRIMILVLKRCSRVMLNMILIVMIFNCYWILLIFGI